MPPRSSPRAKCCGASRVGSGDARFGATPFRLGLWIGGSSTPNTTAAAHEAIGTARQRQGKTGSYADPLKLASCPWCGTALTIEKDVDPDKTRARTIFACPDPTFMCAFTKRNSGGEGLPIVTVDEEIYRLLPAFVIATVDKFAQLPRQGPLHTLFGRVSGAVLASRLSLVRHHEGRASGRKRYACRRPW